MNNRILLAALAGGVAFFLLGWLVWGVLLMDMMRESCPGFAAVQKDPPDFVLIIVSNLCGGLLSALLFSRWAGITTFTGGATAGAWVFGLIALSIDIMYMATTTLMTWAGAATDVVVNIVVGALAAGVVGWVLGYKR
ncbi:MAG: hypothetical protein ABMA02_15395 [Saprospiraceae bacterium]